MSDPIRPCAAGHPREIKTIGLFDWGHEGRDVVYARWARRAGYNPWCAHRLTECPEPAPTTTVPFRAGVASPGGAASYQVLFGFISPEVTAELLAIYRDAPETAWLTGQRVAPGYSRLDMHKWPVSDSLRAFIAHARRVMVEAVGGEPADYDCWLLRYLAGGNIPDHVDPVASGHAARYRLNVLLTPPATSGQLWVAGRPVGMAQGDAVLFSSGTLMHRVDPVPELRLVLSLGALAPKVDA